MLDWFNDHDAETVQSIIALASELVNTITEDLDSRPSVTFPALLTAQAADHITDAAERFEITETYDACADRRNEAAISLVSAMRQTAHDLLHAARTA